MSSWRPPLEHDGPTGGEAAQRAEDAREPSYVPDRGHSARVRARCHAALRTHGDRAMPAHPTTPLAGAGWAALVEATSVVALTVYLVAIVSTAVARRILRRRLAEPADSLPRRSKDAVWEVWYLHWYGQ
jgi:hypothetical protein